MDISRSTLRIFGAKLANAVLTFLGLVYFAKVLGSAELGVFFLFQLTLELLSILGDGGIRFAVEKRLSEGERPSEVLGTALVAKVLLLGLVSLLVIVASPILEDFIGAPIALLLALGVWVHEAGRLMLRVLMGELKVGSTAELRLAQVIVWVGLGSILVARGMGATGMIISFIAGWGVVFLWGYSRKSTAIGVPSIERFRSLFDYSRYSVISYLSGYVYNWMDLAVIGLFLTTSAVGRYEMAWRVGMFITLLSTSLGETVFPQFSEWDATQKQSSIERILPNVVIASVVLVVPALFGGIALSETVMGVLFGEEFVAASLALVILLGERVVFAFHTILGRALLALDEPRLAAKASTLTVVLNLGLNLALVPSYGITGAAIATLVSSLLNGVLHGIYLSRYIAIGWNWLELAWIVIASVGMFGAVTAITKFLHIGSIPILLLVVGIGGAVYFVLLNSYRPMRRKLLNQCHALVSG